MGIEGAPSDLFAKLTGMAPPSRSGSRSGGGNNNKRKSDCCSSPLEGPVESKQARIDQDVKNKKSMAVHQHQHLHLQMTGKQQLSGGHQQDSSASGSPDLAPGASSDDFSGYEEDQEDVQNHRVLPLSVSTIESGSQDAAEPSQQPLNVVTKGFFYVKGSDLRAGYWVYYRGHCVAKALVWNDEFNEIRYDHQGYAPCMRVFNKSNVSPVSIGLLAILDAIAWARSLLSFAHWHIYVDNVDALKLVDMYQRNLQFMKFHADRPLLDSILDVSQSGRIHLHRR